MQVMDGSVTKPLAVEKIEAGDVSGVRIGDRVVLFNSGQGPVSFRVGGNTRVGILATDLEEGEWRVSRDEQAVRMVKVSEAGTAYIEGPPGNYELLRTGR